ncbi:MAG: phasin family protein [Pegethrix bostrychoides GSE-TBD4-15B]|jgi:polyhydroxyalkanoate synthesis regulator phasin|uniref:Phasin family protein n=1 Tax=Pegethrix bostrychoides GSE-TBD4-15B TaxID=2839662 RepID=A0A951U633_9CYAN|nr:phasin family protein [Pegethrix bostrychoides GSE-TBD4-15B]
MPDFGDLVQKAFYLGVGAASYAAEKAGTTLSELRVQAQKLADEMVARGEMTAEDAKRMVDEMVTQAQDPTATPPAAPRRIEILTDDQPETATTDLPKDSPTEPLPDQPIAPGSAPSGVEELRQQVVKLQEELQRLKHS